jgi:uncharacterized protein (DUF1800 family)
MPDDANLPEALRAWQPGEAGFTRRQAAHLLFRAAFGGTPAEIDAVQKLGPAAAVEALLDFPDATAQAYTRGQDVPDDSALEGVPRTDAERRLAFSEAASNAGGREAATTARQLLNQQFRRASRRHIEACAAWWLRRMADGPYPLQERMTLFWSGHFTSSIRDDRDGSWRLWNQNELLRQHAAGNFVEMVRGIVRDPAMLKYLNNDRNVAASPNENLARELMELFTLGVGNYGEDDIKEGARALTGWTHDGQAFSFRRRLHDDGSKTIFGQRGTFGGDDFVALLMAHPACAPYIAGRVYQYLVGAEPTLDLRLALGTILRNANYEMRPLLRTILRSRAFYDEANIGTKIKAPVELVVNTSRVLSLPMPGARQANSLLESLGQVPFAPPNVKGWPGQYDGRRWINTGTLLARYNYGVASADKALAGRDLSAGSTGDFLDAWWARLLPTHTLDATRRRRLAKAAESRRLDAVRLMLSMPEYQLC